MQARAYAHTTAKKMQALLAGSGEELAFNLQVVCRDVTRCVDVFATNGHLALVTLLGAGPDSKTTKHAIAAIGNLLSLDATRVPLVQAGIVAPVVALLRMAPPANSESTVANAAIVVSKLALTSAGIKALQEAGAIAPLVSLLGAAPRTARFAASALWNLSHDREANQPANLVEIREADAIPPLVALLHGETARTAAGALRNLAFDATGAADIRLAGGIVPLVALLHAAEAGTAKTAAAALDNMSCVDKESDPALLSALATCPPPPPQDHDVSLLGLLAALRPTAVERLAAAEADDDAAALQGAIDQAAAVGVADAELQRADRVLRAMREAVEAARRQRRTSLGLDELKTPDDFVCPITYETMQDPVCASDGHTYERSAIEDVLALPEPRRRSPLTRATLQPFVFSNIALKNRIAAYEQEAEALAERAAQKAVRAERIARWRLGESVSCELYSPDAGAASSSATTPEHTPKTLLHKRGRQADEEKDDEAKRARAE